MERVELAVWGLVLVGPLVGCECVYELLCLVPVVALHVQGSAVIVVSGYHMHIFQTMLGLCKHFKCLLGFQLELFSQVLASLATNFIPVFSEVFLAE